MAPRFGGAPKCPRCEKSVYMAEQVLGPGGFWHNSCFTCKECNKRLDSTTLTEKNNEAYCKTCYNRQWGPKGYGFAGGAAFLSTENKLPSEILKEQQSNPSSPILTAPELPSRPVANARPAIPSRPESNAGPVPTLPPRSNLPPHSELSTDEGSLESPEKMASFWSKSGGYTRNHTSYVPRKLNFQSQSDICTGCKKPVYAAELALGAGNKYHKFCLKCTDCGKKLDSTNMVDRDFDLYCRGCYSRAFGPKGYGYGNLLTPEGATR